MADYGSIAEWVAAQGGGGGGWVWPTDLTDLSGLTQDFKADGAALSMGGIDHTPHRRANCSTFDVGSGVLTCTPNNGAYPGNGAAPPVLLAEVEASVGGAWDPAADTVALQMRVPAWAASSLREYGPGVCIYESAIPGTEAAQATESLAKSNYSTTWRVRTTRDGSQMFHGTATGTPPDLWELVVTPDFRIWRAGQFSAWADHIPLAWAAQHIFISSNGGSDGTLNTRVSGSPRYTAANAHWGLCFGAGNPGRLETVSGWRMGILT